MIRANLQSASSLEQILTDGLVEHDSSTITSESYMYLHNAKKGDLVLIQCAGGSQFTMPSNLVAVTTTGFTQSSLRFYRVTADDVTITVNTGGGAGAITATAFGTE